MSDYRLALFSAAGAPRAGIVVGDVVHDAAEATGRPDFASVKAILAAGAEGDAAARKVAANPPPGGRPLAEVTLHAPVDQPSAIFCIGANYTDHSISMAKVFNIPQEPNAKELGMTPWFFIKTPHALAGPDAQVVSDSDRLDWEAELAVVIGRPARNVPVEQALDYVGGYTVGNDLSARDRGARPKIRDGSPFKFDWVAHKNFDGSCPIGPLLVPPSAVADPQNLAIKLWVNDTLRQDSSSSEMIYTVADQIAFLSTLVTLRPGDIILTGTPAGTGVESKTFLAKGDTVTVEIEGLGQLVTHIA